ncbi:MAG TPA: hypothetical protein VGX37_13955 [Allosphingosinicella sp.]|jgi:hypothetical protein|nr:hypothetical protein [Allosphingosinicella sp.]
MSGVPDHDRVAAKPFLISKAADGSYRLTVRETRYNSQNYPIVSANVVPESFASTAAARAYARDRYGAVAGEFTIK